MAGNRKKLVVALLLPILESILVKQVDVFGDLRLPEHLARWDDLLVYDYESTGAETFFCNRRDPKPRSRRLFAFHRPETLHDWLRQPDTLRARLRQMPPLDPRGLRDCQIDAIAGLEKSLAEDRPRALIQLATGAGKTFTACSFSWRLIRAAGAKEVHMRISSPPIVSPCFYGIDTPTKKELIASNHSTEEIRKYITADSLAYLSLDGMLQSSPGVPSQYCNACFTEKYPIAFTRAEELQLGLFEPPADPRNLS